MTIKLNFNAEWSPVFRVLKAQYPVLSEADLEFMSGEENALVERIAAKLKLPAEEIRALLLKLKIKAAGTEPVEI